MHHRAKLRQSRLNHGRDMAIFQFFKMAAAAILDFWNLKFLTVGMHNLVELHHRTKFRQNRSIRGWDMAIFQFFKMAATAILDFWNLKFLTVGTPKRVELHHRTKFRRNRANRGWDKAIFRFSRWRLPPCWICKISNFWWLGRSRASKCIIVPNCVKNGWTTAEIWRFFNFWRWRPPPSWIFNGQYAQKVRTAPSYQIMSKSLKPRLRYDYFQIFKMAAAAILDLQNFKFWTVGTVKRFKMHHHAKLHQNRLNRGWDMAIFQDGGRRYLGFMKFQIFNGWDSQQGRTTSACQISSKSRKLRLRYNNFLIFPRWRPSAILDL